MSHLTLTLPGDQEALKAPGLVRNAATHIELRTRDELAGLYGRGAMAVCNSCFGSSRPQQQQQQHRQLSEVTYTRTHLVARMSASWKPIVVGVTELGETICAGVTEADDGTSSAQVHHVSALNKYEAENWDGEHAAVHHHHHNDEDEAPRTPLPVEEFSGSSVGDDESTPIASSAQFERNRSASLAAALLDVDPQGKPQVGFFHPSTATPLLEAEECEEQRVPTPVAHCETDASFEPTEEALPEPTDAERALAALLFTLRGVKMSAPDRHAAAVTRLRELEEELRTAGAVTPADPQVADAVTRALAAAGPGRDVQIRVNQSRHTTTTKTVYETETPGMVGLDPDKIRELHQQMLSSLSSFVPLRSFLASNTSRFLSYYCTVPCAQVTPAKLNKQPPPPPPLLT